MQTWKTKHHVHTFHGITPEFKRTGLVSFQFWVNYGCQLERECTGRSGKLVSSTVDFCISGCAEVNKSAHFDVGGKKNNPLEITKNDRYVGGLQPDLECQTLI